MPPSGAPFRVPKPKPPLRSPQKRPSSHRLRSRLLSADVLAPAGVGLASLLLWEGLVRWLKVPPYLLPGPLLVLQTLGTEGGELFGSLLITLQITVVAFGAAVVLATMGKKATIQAQTTRAAKVLLRSQTMIRGAIATTGVVWRITA